jgi:hypothetical protein
VVEEKECLLPTEEKIIRTIFFETERDVAVKIPTIEGLLGDKLTAFAPATTGVPFITKHGADFSLQVVKQIFDIGQLFNVSGDIKSVVKAYNASFNQENSYKDKKYTKNQALDDTAETAIELCQINLKGCKPSTTKDALISGIGKIQNHLISSQFRQHLEAKVAASKAYLLSRMIKDDLFDLLTEHGRYEQSSKQIEFIRDSSIDSQLDRLKKLNPEAFYYLALGHKAQNG